MSDASCLDVSSSGQDYKSSRSTKQSLIVKSQTTIKMMARVLLFIHIAFYCNVHGHVARVVGTTYLPNCGLDAGWSSPFGSGCPPSTTDAPTVVQPTTSDDDLVKCGTKAMISRVVGGSIAPPMSTPWQIGIKSCPTCMYFCGGTIIAKRWVVTAAHCLVNYGAVDLIIDAGVTDQKAPTRYKQSFNCTRIYSHQSYGIKAPYDHDIALLLLNKDVVYNAHVRPLCLNKDELRTGQNCAVTGYGRISQTGAKSVHLRQANVPIVARDVCVTAYNTTKDPRAVTRNMFCAGYDRGVVDACAGDSGGPLTCFDRVRQRYVLAGVVSWGVGCAQRNRYGVYTDVKRLTTWITGRIV